MKFAATYNPNGNSLDDIHDAYVALQSAQVAVKHAQRKLCMNIAHGRNYPDAVNATMAAATDRQAVHDLVAGIDDNLGILMKAVMDFYGEATS